MKYVLFILLFINLFIIIYFLIAYSNNEKIMIENRLRKISRKNVRSQYEEELNQPLFKRIIKPMLEEISKAILKITPKEILNNFENKIILAGNPYGFTIKEWTNIQSIMTIILPSVTFLLGLSNKMDNRKIIFIILIEVILGFVLPEMILRKKIMDRRTKILKGLPDVIDFLTVSVEAGLGFDAALSKVVDKMPGTIADEFDRVLQEIKIGKSKKEALKEMSNRIGISDMTTFINSIIQAEQLGVSVGNVLRIQSDQMREKRRQRAQEKAMKAPIKMLLPMVFFIFPTIFTVLIGPVVVKMMNAFLK